VQMKQQPPMLMLLSTRTVPYTDDNRAMEYLI
jgi:hypothetical protein